MTTYPDGRIKPVAQALITCLTNENALNPSPAGLVSYRLGVTGEPLAGTSEDECCDGLAFVRFSRLFASWSTPTPNTVSVNCALAWAAEFEIGIWRCVPIGTVEAPPSTADWLAAQNKMWDDTKTLRATACCFTKTRDPKTVQWGEIAPKSDPEGGCFGVSMMITADLYGRET